MYKTKTTMIHGQPVKVFVKENDDGSVTSFGEYPDNSDYQAYLKWLDEGNEPLPPDEGESN
jgi:hypothetical protein